MDELMQLAGKLGVELPDEMLDGVAGGWFHFGLINARNGWTECPICWANMRSRGKDYLKNIGHVTKYECVHCGFIYTPGGGIWYNKSGNRLTPKKHGR